MPSSLVIRILIAILLGSYIISPGRHRHMKSVLLIHNPTAGDKEHSGKELVSLIEAAGYKCRHLSTKDDEWESIKSEADILAVAGGDGTLRKVAMAILRGKLNAGTAPLAFIPAGTANNLGKSLGLMRKPKKLVAAWKSGEVRGFDVGKVEGLGEKTYFLEGFGFGIFPRLMTSLDRIRIGPDADAEEK